MYGAKIVGIDPVKFKDKDTGEDVVGVSIYYTEPLDTAGGEGYIADRIFVREDRLKALDFTPKVGQNVEILYNKKGKLKSFRLIAEQDALDFGSGVD